MSLESYLEVLATMLDEWASRDRAAASTSESTLKHYWLGRADGWEEAAIHIRKGLDEHAPLPDKFDWKAIHTTIECSPGFIEAADRMYADDPGRTRR